MCGSATEEDYVPVGMIVHLPEGDAALYDSVMSELEWDTKEKPAGWISHYAGAGSDGWYVMDVWESPADFEAFAQERLGPALAAAAGDDAPAVEPTFFPIHRQDHAG
jgi:hypothetical protein